jgi:hypothetical protein
MSHSGRTLGWRKTTVQSISKAERKTTARGTRWGSQAEKRVRSMSLATKHEEERIADSGHGYILVTSSRMTTLLRCRYLLTSLKRKYSFSSQLMLSFGNDNGRRKRRGRSVRRKHAAQVVLLAGQFLVPASLSEQSCRASLTGQSNRLNSVLPCFPSSRCVALPLSWWLKGRLTSNPPSSLEPRREELSHISASLTDLVPNRAVLNIYLLGKQANC